MRVKPLQALTRLLAKAATKHGRDNAPVRPANVNSAGPRDVSCTRYVLGTIARSLPIRKLGKTDTISTRHTIRMDTGFVPFIPLQFHKLRNISSLRQIIGA